MFRLILPALVVSTHAMAMDNLKVAYKWKKLDFVYPSVMDRQDALISRKLSFENNIPTGLEVYEDRLFLAIPRLLPGVAASLAYINISESPMDSPKLHPYPDWRTHDIHKSGDPPQIVSPFKIRADSCGRLWVLDTGVAAVMDMQKPQQLVKPRLVIYDLHTDQLLRTYTIPDDQMHRNESIFVNIAVEDTDCDDTFAYLADVYAPGLVVYSYKMDKSWLVKHHYFSIDPLAGNMTIGGVNIFWSDGIFGLALSGPDSEGFSTLYFHPLVSFDEFAVSTKVLRDENLATNSSANFHQFKPLGTRGGKAQSGASFLDKESKVIFFAFVHLNAVMCWRTTTNYTIDSHSRVYWNNETMIYPSDIKVDANRTLWVLSNKLPMMLNSKSDTKEYNFRILNGTVAEAIKYTACNSKMVVNKTIIEKIKGASKNKLAPSSGDNTHSGLYLLTVLLVALMLR